jgi:hypothetical protein
MSTEDATANQDGRKRKEQWPVETIRVAMMATTFMCCESWEEKNSLDLVDLLEAEIVTQPPDTLGSTYNEWSPESSMLPLLITILLPTTY